MSEKRIGASLENKDKASIEAQNDMRDQRDISPSDPPNVIGRWLSLFAADQHTSEKIEETNGKTERVVPANPFHTWNPPVEEIAVPKVEIVAVPMDIKLKSLVEIFKESGRTRLPVYDKSLDAPCGFIHLKDLALQHGFNGNGGRFKLKKEMLRRLLYVPGNMRVAVLLEQMRSQRIHMALVIDEYGGTDGLVTIEDLVEVIFGDIADEHDDVSDIELLKEENDGTFLCHARLTLEEFSEKLGIGVDIKEGLEDDVDTLGGLIFILAGRVPVAGEVVRHSAANLDFEIVAANRSAIRQIRVRTNSSGAI